MKQLRALIIFPSDVPIWLIYCHVEVCNPTRVCPYSFQLPEKPNGPIFGMGISLQRAPPKMSRQFTKQRRRLGIYIYIHMCVCVFTYLNVNMYVCTYIYIYIYVYDDVCMYICACTHAYIYLDIDTHTITYIYVCI